MEFRSWDQIILFPSYLGVHHLPVLAEAGTGEVRRYPFTRLRLNLLQHPALRHLAERAAVATADGRQQIELARVVAQHHTPADHLGLLPADPARRGVRPVPADEVHRVDNRGRREAHEEDDADADDAAGRRRSLAFLLAVVALVRRIVVGGVARRRLQQGDVDAADDDEDERRHILGDHAEH